MITNEVQYHTTKAHLARFEQAIENLEAALPSPAERKLHRVQLDALRSQADDLRTELADFEQLRSGQITTIEADSLAALANALIKARIVRGWSQRNLADKLGIAEQQIQRYEATDYAAASLARLCDIADALNLTIHETLNLRGPDAA